MEEHKQVSLKEDTSNVFQQGEQDFMSTPNVLETSKSLVIKQTLSVFDDETRFKKGQLFKRTEFDTLVSGSVYSVAVSDYLVGITSLSYAPSVGLPKPTLVGEGKTYIVKDEVGGAATTTITIRSSGEANIDGASTSTLVIDYASRTFYTDGANWFTI